MVNFIFIVTKKRCYICNITNFIFLKMTKQLKTGEVILSCVACKKNYKVQTLQRGRVKKYCSDKCKTKAYRLRNGILGKKFQNYFLDGNRPEQERFKDPSEYERKVPKEREKRASFIKRVKDYDFPGYLSFIRRYNKLFKLIQRKETTLEHSSLIWLYGVLKSNNVAEHHKNKIAKKLTALEKQSKTVKIGRNLSK